MVCGYATLGRSPESGGKRCMRLRCSRYRTVRRHPATFRRPVNVRCTALQHWDHHRGEQHIPLVARHFDVVFRDRRQIVPVRRRIRNKFRMHLGEALLFPSRHPSTRTTYSSLHDVYLNDERRREFFSTIDAVVVDPTIICSDIPDSSTCEAGGRFGGGKRGSDESQGGGEYCFQRCAIICFD